MPNRNRAAEAPAHRRYSDEAAEGLAAAFRDVPAVITA